MSEIDEPATLSFAGHVKQSLNLGLPLVGAQLAQMAIFTTDVAMVGRLGEQALAAVTLGSQLIFFLLVLSMGFSIVLIPIAAEAIARQQFDTLRSSLHVGFFQALLLSVLLLPWLYFSEALFLALGQDPVASAGAADYVHIALWALPFVLLLNVLRSYFSALEFAKTLLLITLAGVAVNFVADYALVFGHFGAPALGAEGAAAASVITNVAMFLALLLAASRLPMTATSKLFLRPYGIDRAMFNKLFGLGLPISLSLMAEVGMFQVAALMIGTLGITQLAAHGVVLQLASIVFMVPLGLAQMVTIRAGAAKGCDDMEGVRLAALAALMLVLGFNSLSALAFFLFPETLISLYLDFDLPEASDVLAFAVPMLFAAAAFQVVDGAQAIAMGTLRGIQDIRAPSFYSLICYWGVGVSTSYILGFTLGWGSVGIWIGLAVGLAAAAVLFWGRLWRRHIAHGVT